jgi:predicted ArsR family transcriptional regulator
MRALAHPTRAQMLVLLRREALSASDLASRLDIRFGSARFHLSKLIEAGIAQPAGERVIRGGKALLYEVPEKLWVDIPPEAPPALTAALHRATMVELGRRLEAAAFDQRTDDTIHDVMILREIALLDEDRASAEAIVGDALAKLLALDAGGAEAARAHTVALLSFRTPDGSRPLRPPD